MTAKAEAKLPVNTGVPQEKMLGMVIAFLFDTLPVGLTGGSL
jgi:hypothetical protein